MNQGINNRNALQIVNRNCAGIDVHRDFVCVTTLCGPDGAIESEYRTFQTTKRELLMLREWLLELNIHVAGIESTGKLWFPLLNAFSEDIRLLVYNARNMKNLPGRKTDKADSEWIAGVTRHALITPSFVPDMQTREARLISRTRRSLVEHRTAIRQQIHGILDSADIKIASVISDIFGYSGTNLLQLLCKKQTITEAAVKKCIHHSMLKKLDRIMEGLDGYFADVHRALLKNLLSIHEFFVVQIEKIEIQLKEHVFDQEDKIEVMEKLIAIPGMAERSATLVLSEIGFDLSSFSNCRKFCNWAGVAPGRNESAGKNKSGRILMRQRYLRALLVEVALSAVHTRGTFYEAKFAMLKRRMCPKKALIAIAHKIAKAIYRIIHDGKDYVEITDRYILADRTERDLRLLSRLTERLGKDTIQTYIADMPQIISQS